MISLRSPLAGRERISLTIGRVWWITALAQTSLIGQCHRNHHVTCGKPISHKHHGHRALFVLRQSFWHLILFVFCLLVCTPTCVISEILSSFFQSFCTAMLFLFVRSCCRWDKSPQRTISVHVQPSSLSFSLPPKFSTSQKTTSINQYVLEKQS